MNTTPYMAMADALDEFGTMVASGDIEVNERTGLEIMRVAEMAARAIALATGQTPEQVCQMLYDGAPTDDEWAEMLPDIQRRGKEAVAKLGPQIVMPDG